MAQHACEEGGFPAPAAIKRSAIYEAYRVQSAGHLAYLSSVGPLRVVER